MLLVVLAVHEDEIVAVPVQIGGVAAIHRRGLDLHPGVVGLVDNLPGQHVLEFGSHEGRALTRFDVLELNDGPKLAIDVQYEAVLEIGSGCHGRSFSFGFLSAAVVGA